MIETAPEQDLTPEDPASVLAGLRAARVEADAVAARMLSLALDWAAMHPAETIDQAAGWPVQGCERDVALAGEGTPTVAEFCVADLAAALGMTNDAGRAFLGAALELAHRLPRLHARVMAGELPAWRARRVAERTTPLPPAGAAWVDRHLAPVAHKVGLPTIERLVSTATAEFDPDTAERDARVAADGRHATLDLHADDFTGTVTLSGCLDLADGLDLEHALRGSAETQLMLGSGLSLDQRRARALGEIARTQLALDLSGPGAGAEAGGADAPGSSVTRAPAATRAVVLHVHISRSAVAVLANEPATVRHPMTGEVLVFSEQVRTWCQGAASVTVVPVVDLAEEVVVDGYDVPTHLARQIRLRDVHCVFPYCRRPAAGCDLDHVIPYGAGGRTTSTNLASC